MLTKENSKIVLFDGECNLCSFSVAFILKRSPKKQFQFASLQSDFGQKLLEKFSLPKNSFDSVVLVEGNQVYTKSTAALRIAMRLQGLWPLLRIFFLMPSSLRDFLYSFVAQNRYAWFGKKTSCLLPKEEWKDCFLS
ncbi:MAG: thiol-disulfide oxidoreductase DCC family protein [Candidatus Brocadiae bacterium]|nr:thiol-disulfide oxidoreductase DCC family protein [Candidatus Brocadiia bacterium]